MGLDGKYSKLDEKTCLQKALSLHAYADLSNVSPVVFVYLLKECYSNGACKATKKFRVLQHQVHQSLYNAPQPGPAVFVIHCLRILPILGIYSEGFSHLLLSSFCRFIKCDGTPHDLVEAKLFAARMFIDIVGGSIMHEERILIKLLEAFDIQLIDIENVMGKEDVIHIGNTDAARTLVEDYIFSLVEAQSFMTAVTLLERFSIDLSGESFLLKMMNNNDYRAAEKWATHRGKHMLCVLVEEYVKRNLCKHAYETIKKNNLKQDFPGVYHQGKESSLKNLAEKGCWDVAEAKAKGDKQLIQYMVYLAMEAGYTEKVDELCDRYSIQGFVSSIDSDASLLRMNYLQFNELVSDDIIWVDKANGLLDATCRIEGCNVVGIDCEWKPNYIKGGTPNKVSIMQLATEKEVFIFDLIKLAEDVPDTLDHCLTRIFQSPRILKLGYNFQCDMKQLSRSYGGFGCFKHYDMLLDIQNVFKEPSGGLSGLAQKILGAGLNKTRRNSNWEQRPLHQNQLEYAAMDAVVLIHIFYHVRNHSTVVCQGNSKVEWKSHIISSIDNNLKKTR
ncbi:uncharacterized protein LOC124912354 [Impatiens glandulifera]|uniref:uncharacterized protein LOC124912354 n=1 Tax=Impatiens glandulifera TaxID=253017 RepID=UPI001FB0FA16|nr:uncharacterized protein LOC124912354 [Impatiens glandulifera]XP_047308919.1 uncharacterized protein LOC124912354 [Impatiens glandulifera]